MERVAIRVPEDVSETWLGACADELSQLKHVAFGARMGRGRPDSAVADGDAPWIDEAAAGAPEQLQAAGVTLLVDLSGRALPPAFGGVRRWMPVFGEAAMPRFSFADALLDHRRALLARLVEVTHAGTGKVLEEGRLRPVPHSPSATRARVQSTVARWPARVLARMRAGFAGREQRILLASEVGSSCLRELTVVPRAVIARLQAFATEERWAIGIIERPIAALTEGIDHRPVRWLPLPEDGGLADPFALARADGLRIVAEQVRGAEQLGVIVSCRETDAGRPRPVLPSRGHASYPFLIEDGGEVFMLPELSASGRIQLFRADPFPERWLPDAVLLDDLAGVDPTVVRHRGMWWLFTGDQRDQADARLHLFMATDLRGPWQRHPRSPVKDDLAGARPAGTPFVVAGQLYRPAQDCSRHYGEAVIIHRVDVLTPEAYAETPIARIDPDPMGPYPHGLHTISAAGARTLVDGKRQHRSASTLLRAVRRSLREWRITPPEAPRRIPP